ncbi:MAG TPA: hypothetical protein VIL73_02610 [Gaiellaceae bacterium]|jgi:hypothetical protein
MVAFYRPSLAPSVATTMPSTPDGGWVAQQARNLIMRCTHAIRAWLLYLGGDPAS